MHRRKINLLFSFCRADVARDVEVEIVLLDFLHADPARVARRFLAQLIGVDNFVNMLGQKLVLPFASLEALGSVDEQHIVRFLALLQHQDTHWDAGGEEQVGR